MNINNILNNPSNIYYGHGTGIEDKSIINSIMTNGLRCSHGSLYYTSVVLGQGMQIPQSQQEMLKNWPHLESKIIVVVSLPIQYKILDIVGSGTYNKGDSAYYYIPSEETREKYSLTNSPYVMPEFVVGYYDARTDTFTRNPKYYENLPQNEQVNLFNQVKENYFNVVDEGWGIDEYKELVNQTALTFGLTDEEVSKFKRNKEEFNLLLQIPFEVLNKQMILPNGNKISARQYIQEIVLPHIPTSGFIFLNNGAKLPISHFIIECVVYDCQERYNGDFVRYMQENVRIEGTNQLHNNESRTR